MRFTRNLASVLLAAMMVLGAISLTACTAGPAEVSPTPTVTPTRSPSPTPSISPTVSPSPTISPSPTRSPSPSPTLSPSPSPSPTGAIGRVEVLGVWGGEELTSFQEMVKPWEQQTGGQMAFTGTRDLIAILTTRIAANNPPDVAILPNPGQMQELARAGNLKSMDFLDKNKLNQQYAKVWLDLGSVNNQLYSIFSCHNNNLGSP